MCHSSLLSLKLAADALKCISLTLFPGACVVLIPELLEYLFGWLLER